MSIKKLTGKILFYLLALAILVYSLFPFYYSVVSSLKSSAALFDVTYFPFNPDFGNYKTIFRDQPFGRNIVNSLIVSSAVVILSLFLSTTAAYALGRIKFRGRKLLLFSILGASMFPQVAVLSGMFEVIRFLGLYNNPFGLIFSYMVITLPFTVWVLTTFMGEVPVELEEAAIIDGATPLQIITKVFMPLLGPAFVATGILAFIAAWNEFLFALTFTLTNEQCTVPVAIALLSGSSSYELPWGNIMAASVIVTIPLILLVLFFQRRIVAGLTAGSIKM